MLATISSFSRVVPTYTYSTSSVQICPTEMAELGTTGIAEMGGIMMSSILSSASVFRNLV